MAMISVDPWTGKQDFSVDGHTYAMTEVLINAEDLENRLAERDSLKLPDEQGCFWDPTYSIYRWKLTFEPEVVRIPCQVREDIHLIIDNVSLLVEAQVQGLIYPHEFGVPMRRSATWAMLEELGCRKGGVGPSATEFRVQDFEDMLRNYAWPHEAAVGEDQVEDHRPDKSRCTFGEGLGV